VISNKALEEKKLQVLEQWFKTHIPTYYIHIDNDYSGCSSIRDWWNASNMASNQQ
jgi:peptidyl-prolyl cis-trans isomerase SurA